MASTNLPSAVLLFLTFVAGIYCLHVLGFTQNGLMPRLESILSSPTPLWPGTTSPLKQTFTGIIAIDTPLFNLNPFFAHVLDGSDPCLSLWSLFFMGQYAVAFGLCHLEGLRAGNRGRLVSFVTTWFTLGQLVGFAVLFPVYLLTHVLTSPLSKSPTTSTPRAFSTLITIPLAPLKTLPYALALGCLIPSILVAVPTTSAAMQQNLLSVWQVFPIWTFIFLTLITTVSLPSKSSGKKSSRKSKTPPPPASTSPTPTQYLNQLNRTYTFLLVLAASAHLPTLVITLYPTLIRPFFPVITKRLLTQGVNFSSVFVPYSPLLSWRAKDLADAVHVFLWWDAYVSSSAALIWAVTNLRAASVSLTGTLPGAVLATALAGPFGGVVWMVWERDVAILNASGAKKEA